MIPLGRGRWLLPILMVAGCSGKAGAGDESGLAPVVQADVATIAIGPFVERVHAIGTVVPRPGAVALLSAPAATRVARVSVTAGQPVAPGALLVEFEPAPFQARAQSAEAALRAAERAAERTRTLLGQGIVSRRELDQAEADLARARADAVAARREAELVRLESPFAGVVTRMNAVLGASVDANQPLVEIANPAQLDLVIGVTPDQAARIHRGASIALFSGDGTGSDSLGSATVVDVGAAIDSTTRSVPVRARVAGTRRPLRIGENLTTTIVVGQHLRALVVPAEALVPAGENFKVYVVDPQGVAHERAVTIGGRAAGVAEVTHGLRPGERVVTYGAFGVEDGARIVPRGKAP